MTTDKHDPWALLREARQAIRPIHTLDETTGTYRWFHDALCRRIDFALEAQNSSTVIVEPEPPLKLRKGDKVEVRVTRAEEVAPVTFSIGDPPLNVDPADVWVLRFCDLVDIDGTTEEKRLEAFAQLYDCVKASRRAAIKEVQS